MKKICFWVLVVAFLAGCRSVPPRVSILGDSYSTFQGWIPEGNAVWYPYAERSVNDVAEASECWWSQVIEALGGELEANESWSGSTICYTSYNGIDRPWALPRSSWCAAEPTTAGQIRRWENINGATGRTMICWRSVRRWRSCFST